MQHQLLTPIALLSIAVLGVACGSGDIGASNGDARSVTPPPNAFDGGIDDDAWQSAGEIVEPPLPDDGPWPDRPWEHNTGPSDPGALTPSSGLSITTDGAVLENLDISGMVRIDADNVTLRNFKIHDSDGYCIRVKEGHSGILVEDGEVYDCATGIMGAGFTARRLYIHDMETDGLKTVLAGGPTLVEYCFLEKLGKRDGAHADGNQITTRGANITFRYNNIWLPKSGTPNDPGPPYKSNATFMNSGSISNVLIDQNWLNGGNYTIYCEPGISATNNLFGRDNGRWYDGKEHLRIRKGTCDAWSGNRWEDTGDPI